MYPKAFLAVILAVISPKRDRGGVSGFVVVTPWSATITPRQQPRHHHQAHLSPKTTTAAAAAAATGAAATSAVASSRRALEGFPVAADVAGTGRLSYAVM